MNEDRPTATAYATRPGSRFPPGATALADGVNFCVFSRHATSVELLLYAEADSPEPFQAIALPPERHRTFSFWHVFVEGLPLRTWYTWRVDGPRDTRETGRRFNARKELVDPRAWAVGTIADTYRKYPDIGTLLPAMGYGDQQVKDLEATIDQVPADVVVIGTPIDLSRIVRIRKPTVRVQYELQEIGQPTLDTVLAGFIKHALAGQAMPA